MSQPLQPPTLRTLLNLGFIIGRKSRKEKNPRVALSALYSRLIKRRTTKYSFLSAEITLKRILPYNIQNFVVAIDLFEKYRSRLVSKT